MLDVHVCGVVCGVRVDVRVDKSVYVQVGGFNGGKF